MRSTTPWEADFQSSWPAGSSKTAPELGVSGSNSLQLNMAAGLINTG